MEGNTRRFTLITGLMVFLAIQDVLLFVDFGFLPGDYFGIFTNVSLVYVLVSILLPSVITVLLVASIYIGIDMLVSFLEGRAGFIQAITGIFVSLIPALLILYVSFREAGYGGFIFLLGAVSLFSLAGIFYVLFYLISIVFGRCFLCKFTTIAVLALISDFLAYTTKGYKLFADTVFSVDLNMVFVFLLVASIFYAVYLVVGYFKHLFSIEKLKIKDFHLNKSKLLRTGILFLFGVFMYNRYILSSISEFSVHSHSLDILLNPPVFSLKVNFVSFSSLWENTDNTVYKRYAVNGNRVFCVPFSENARLYLIYKKEKGGYKLTYTVIEGREGILKCREYKTGKKCD